MPEAPSDLEYVAEITRVLMRIDSEIRARTLQVSEVTLRNILAGPEGTLHHNASVVVRFVITEGGDTVAILESAADGDGLWDVTKSHYFGDDGSTIAATADWRDPENGCAETIDVELRYVLRGNQVLQQTQVLKDQDGHEVNTDDCMLGRGETVFAFGSRRAYLSARRIKDEL